MDLNEKVKLWLFLLEQEVWRNWHYRIIYNTTDLGHPITNLAIDMDLFFDSLFIEKTIKGFFKEDVQVQGEILNFFNREEEVDIPLIAMSKDNLFVYESLKLAGKPLVRANRADGSEYCSSLWSRWYPKPDEVKGVLKAIAHYVPDVYFEQEFIGMFKRFKSNNAERLLNWVKAQVCGLSPIEIDNERIKELITNIEKLDSAEPLRLDKTVDPLRLAGVNPFLVVKDFFELNDSPNLNDFIEQAVKLTAVHSEKIFSQNEVDREEWARWITWFSTNYWVFVRLKPVLDKHTVITFTQQIPLKRLKTVKKHSNHVQVMYRLGEAQSMHIEYHLTPSVLAFGKKKGVDVEVLTDIGWQRVKDPKSVLDNLEDSDEHLRHFYTTKKCVDEYGNNIRTFRISLKWDIESLTKRVLDFILASFVVLGFLGIVFGSLTIVGSLALTSTLFFTFARLPREDPAFMASARKRLKWILGVVIAGLVLGVGRILLAPPDSLVEGIESLYFWVKSLVDLI